MSNSPFDIKHRYGTCYATWYARRKAKELTGKYGFDGEDLAQELALHLLCQWPQYDPTKGKPTTFIQNVVDTKVCELIRDRCHPKRDYRCHRRLSAVGEAAEHGLLDGVRGQPEVSDQERAEIRADCETVLGFLLKLLLTAESLGNGLLQSGDSAKSAAEGRRLVDRIKKFRIELSSKQDEQAKSRRDIDSFREFKQAIIAVDKLESTFRVVLADAKSLARSTDGRFQFPEGNIESLLAYLSDRNLRIGPATTWGEKDSYVQIYQEIKKYVREIAAIETVYASQFSEWKGIAEEAYDARQTALGHRWGDEMGGIFRAYLESVSKEN